MKKEVFAVLLLVLILGISLLNSHMLNTLTNDLSDIVKECDTAASAEKWPEARKHIEDALSLWKKNDHYTHVVLRHSDIDSMTNDFYELLEHVYSENSGAVSGIARLVDAHLKSIISMEKIRLGSIF